MTAGALSSREPGAGAAVPGPVVSDQGCFRGGMMGKYPGCMTWPEIVASWKMTMEQIVNKTILLLGKASKLRMGINVVSGHYSDMKHHVAKGTTNCKFRIKSMIEYETNE